MCQVNGKLRDRVQAASDATEELKELCHAAPNVRAHVDGKQIVKEIVVPGKLVNLVVRRRRATASLPIVDRWDRRSASTRTEAGDTRSARIPVSASTPRSLRPGIACLSND